MHPDGPTAVTVTLTGGPCDGQIVNVWPRGGGLLPYSFEALTPADHWDDVVPTAADYHTYVRVGDARTARRYIHIKEVTPSVR